MQPNLSHLYEATPSWLDAFFVVVTLFPVGMLYAAVRRASNIGATRFLVVSLIWLVGLALLAHSHFFNSSIPGLPVLYWSLGRLYYL